MDPLTGAKPPADVRDYLAEERTFLAWIRTGLAVMAFGFVVARFGLFLQEIKMAPSGSATSQHQLSLWFGTALIAAGVVANLWSAWRHTRVVAALNRGQFGGYVRPSRQAVVLAVFLAVVGAALAIHLTSA